MLPPTFKPKIYRVSPVLIALFVALTLALVTAFGFIFFGEPNVYHQLAELGGKGYIILGGLALLLLLLCIRIVDLSKKKLIINRFMISSEGLFSKRSLPLDKIAGYLPHSFSRFEATGAALSASPVGLAGIPARIRKRNIVVVPVDQRQKKILIPKYLAGQKEILGWLEAHFPDLERLVETEGAQVYID